MLKNGRITLEKNVTMDYVAFGRGTRPLVILPGLGDGLRGVKGTALPMSILYWAFSKDFRVYLFSRKDPLLPSRTTRDFARDQKAAMDRLGISKADVVGVSQGGMIAQFLAIDYPEAVGKLVLCATCPQPNPTLETAVTLWMRMARRGDAMSLMRDNVERIYSPRYVKRLGWLAPIVGLLTAPSSFHRFLVMAQACLDHNALEELANKIPGSRLVMYPDLGHSVYEEAPDFQSRVLEFLLEP